MGNSLASLMDSDFYARRRREQLAREMSHPSSGYIPTKDEISQSIDVGLGRVPYDIAYGEQGLQAPAVAGGLVSLDPTDYLSGAGLAKLAAMAKVGGAGLASLAGGMTAMNKLGAQSVPRKFGQSGAVIFGKYNPAKELGGQFPELSGVSRRPNPAIVVAEDNMNLSLTSLPEEKYQADFYPLWGSKEKPFSAIGDNPQELLETAKNRINRSSKAIDASIKSKHEKSLVGKLESEFGDVFDYKKSARSESEYITHKPSGAKIRISGHKLPLAYEGADLDIPNNLSTEEKLKMIMDYLK